MTAPAVQAEVAEVVAGCPLLALRDDGDCWSDDEVAVVRSRGRLHAFEAQCPHGSASLVGAPVVRGAVVCPRHGARFRLSDGKPLSGPARRPLAVYDAQETPDGVVVRRRSERAAARRTFRQVLTALSRPARPTTG